MGMDIGGGDGKKGRGRPEMNVTPLVDIVLVLLIIFMVLTPALMKAVWITLPEKPDEAQPPSDGDEPIVVSVNSDGTIQINASEQDDEEFPDRLRRVLAARGTRTIVFDAHEDVSYARAVEAMDLAKEGGANTIAVATAQIPGVE